jgi:hypothetical protein
LCLSATSKRPGNIAGIGEFVHSLIGASAGTGVASGTSMATPQVAAVTAYLWSLSPSFIASQIRSIVQFAARPGVAAADPGCDAAASSIVVDAYDAILAADRFSTGVASDAPARLAIFDVADGTGSPADADGTPAGNGEFDEYDIELFKQAFAASSGGVDFSRFDLNGDGRTGTAVRNPFDLDSDFFKDILTQNIEGETVSFDESGLTDMDLLCYYAYSSLFTGDTTLREGQIGNACNLPITIKADGTGIGWYITDPDENTICCTPLVLPQDSPPPVSMALGDGSFSAYRPSPNELAIDVTGAGFSDPQSDASSMGSVSVRAELAFDSPGTLVVDIDPGLAGTGILDVRVTILETNEQVRCDGGSSLNCFPSASLSSPVPGPGTRTVHVVVGIRPGSVSGRAVTIRRQ